MAHSFTNLPVHIIFSTKEHQPFLDDEIRPDVFAYLGGIIRRLGGQALLVGGTADHVHALVLLPATLAVAELLRDLKANASGWVHKRWPARAAFGWQVGYGAFGVSLSNVPAVKAYIARQAQHHRKVTFEEEFLAFLKKHGIAYDPRYLWR
jgi:REP element-mobilizing transposase RayT